MVDRIDFSEVPKDRGYDSAFESDFEAAERRKSYQGLVAGKKKREKVANKRQLEEELIKEEGKIHRFHAVSVDAFSRHKEYINNYLLYYGGSIKEFSRDKSRDKTDMDVVREHHQFLWDGNDETDNWEKQLAKKYYDKLFKEYCIADLSRYKENTFGMRWRIEKEVIDGKGQFICGNKKCEEKEGLRSWEVNFGYVEQGEKKNALVKLRLCPDCSYKLNYHQKRKEVRQKTKEKSSEPVSGGKRQRTNDDAQRPSSSKEDNSKNKEKHTKENVDGGEERESELWSRPLKQGEDKSREDEFDDYFSGMFL
uniref:Protein FRA10AC1 n=1 Tax=Arion vulgaris TaxID=1028688 RepID=A0A0B7A6P0_9EUPU